MQWTISTNRVQIYSCDGKAAITSVSHDPSEFILIWCLIIISYYWCLIIKMVPITINVENILYFILFLVLSNN